MSAGALEAIDRVLNRGGEADEVLGQVVAILTERGGCSYAAITFPDGDAHVSGRADCDTVTTPVVFQDAHVADLVAPAGVDGAFLTRVATLVSAYCDGR
jgi:hypothetical protein